MNVTINWLKKYIDFDFSAEQFAEKLTMLGVEVETIKQLGVVLEGVVVGKVTSINPHPNADKLVLCQVDIDKDDTLQIVCGAPNVREGMVAPVATIGTELHSGVFIKKTKIRGEESFGMLCSEKELGISPDAAGLMELSNDLTIGTPLAEALGLDDTVLELEITPNRPDCLSLIGVAREIRAETGNELRLPQIKLNESEMETQEITVVTIDDPQLCPRYAARIIKDVKIGESPDWLKHQLETVGIAVINNIVDITNYVLMEYGQPLHAFDYHKLNENRIVVRRAAEGERITTLDEYERKLTPDMLVIADAEKPVAVAGVMGGLDTEITDTTRDVLLESAYFLPSSIRATAKTMGLNTDASYRFERGADPENVIPALNRAAQLIAEIADGTICKGIVDVYPGKREPIQITLRPERVNFILGTTLKKNEIAQILLRLGFELIEPKPKENAFLVTVPSFRVDITREIDLIEEVARVYGYDNIPTTLPKGDIPIPIPNKIAEVCKRIKNFLLSSGMMEAINYSFVHPNCFEKIRLPEDNPLRDTLKLQNPLSPEMSILRSTLIPSLLNNAQHNHNHQINNIALFEMSTVFVQGKEPARVSGILAGEIGDGIYGNPNKNPDFFDIKGIVEGVLEVCGITDYAFKLTEEPTFHPGRNAELLLKNKRIGILGEAHPDVLANYELPYKAYLFELDLDTISDAADFSKRFKPIPIYPSIQRDLAIVVDKEMQSDLPIDIIYSTGGNLVESVKLFDLYVGDQVQENKKSLAYTIMYHSATETLTDKAVNELHDKVIKKLYQELNAELRM